MKMSCEQALVEAELGTLLRFYLSQITDDLSARNFAPEFVDTLSNRLGRATRFEDWGQADLLGKHTGPMTPVGSAGKGRPSSNIIRKLRYTPKR